RAVGGDVPPGDVVERLDDPGGRKVTLQELRGGRLAAVELLDMTVALVVVVVGVEHDLPRQRLDGDPLDGAQRHAHDHDVAGASGLLRGRRTGLRAELGDETAQRLGTAEFAITTSYPAVTATRATWLPMRPAPMIPKVVMPAVTSRPNRGIPAR